MHITNIPTILSSLTFLLPFYAAVDTGNAITAFHWGALTTTSLLLHITKQPFHIHGHGNCIPILQLADTLVVYAVIVRAQIDGYYAGPAGLLVSMGVVFWARLSFTSVVHLECLPLTLVEISLYCPMSLFICSHPLVVRA